ncbi:MAG TPA: PQQ-dependent sugar dehydrogenase, partial [Devosia sp.]|nr:PQQ-dependent sugar dehydrogenase [Devosia sp.]
MLRFLAHFTLAAALATPVAAQAPFRLETVASGLDSPVFVTAPAGDPRLFIVEQTGRIRVFADGALADAPFLDVTAQISSGGEQGLLGLAFHPNYASNGRFFVNFTDPSGDTRVVAYTVSADPAVADPASAQELLAIKQPYSNHNGGWIGFGPDGLLYAGMGDGGSGGDPQGNGQNPDSLLGKILTFDVDSGGPPKIFASGVRNPWRNAFDGADFYIADVGQNRWEEINVISAGQPGPNLGWNTMEGPDCFEAATCDTSGFVLPVHSYNHDEGCSITGGYVYRGAGIPAISGLYF